MSTNSSVLDAIRLDDRVVVITGGGGFLGYQHAEGVAEMGGSPILLDVNEQSVLDAAERLRSAHAGCNALGIACDITSESDAVQASRRILSEYGRVDGLVNNAARNPKVESGTSKNWSRLADFPIEDWNADISVGLTGAFICSRVFGGFMADRGQGVILNIASDLALIGPDQRIYRQEGLDEAMQPVKPVSYSIVKSGLLGLTRYLATYWASSGVRVNAICPGGVETGNEAPDFVEKLTRLIPLGRMARPDEYRATIVYLLSDASSYMTGSVLSIDGGRTAW